MPYGDKKSYSFFKMKYQGNSSAFPFKSPLKDHEKHSEGWVIEHPNQTTVEVEKLKRKNETEDERLKRIAENYKTPAGAK